MITIYTKENDKLIASSYITGMAIPKNTVWIDLFNFRCEEEQAIADYFHINLPTEEEMREIEVSNRLYKENNSFFMTICLVNKSELLGSKVNTITFIIVNDLLITLRYADSHIFTNYASHAMQIFSADHSGRNCFVALVENMIDYIADVFENISHNVDIITRKVFYSNTNKIKQENGNFQEVLERIGYEGDLLSKAHESLITINRMIIFCTKSYDIIHNEVLKVNLDIMSRDVVALNEHVGFLSNNINFLLNATLGMINIEQNNIIKIFSIATVVFLPPTLIADIYGMNFRFIPGMEWHYGYPVVILAMIISSWLPYKYFKRKKWL